MSQDLRSCAGHERQHVNGIRVSRRPAVWNLGVLASGELLSRGLTFLAFAHLGRVLDISDFGLVGSTLSVMMFCTLLVDQGLGVLGTREIAKDHSATGRLVGGVVSLQLGLAVAVFGVVTVGALALPADPRLMHLLWGFAVSLLGIPFLLNWVFQAQNRMFWYASPLVLRQGVFLAVALLLVHESSDLRMLPLAEVAAVFAAAVCFVAVYRRAGGSLGLHAIGRSDRRLLREALPIGGSQFIWALRMYLPILVVLTLIDSTAAGRFESAHRIVMVFLALLGVCFTHLFPAMSATYHRSATDLVRQVYRAGLWILTPTVALAVMTVVAAPTMIHLVFGAKYAGGESVRTLIVMSWMVPILAWRRTGRSALIVLNRQRIELVCSVTGMILLIALIVPMTRSYGIVGSAWAMVLSELAATLLTWAVLQPRLAELRVASPVGSAAN